VSVYLRSGKLNGMWARARVNGTQVSLYQAFSVWAKQEPIAFGLYFLLIWVVIFFPRLVRGHPNLWGPSLLIITLLSAYLITKPLSGHDETAHIDMFYRAGQSVFEEKNDTKVSPGYTRTFHANVLRLANQSDFYYLHGVELVQGKCPHFFLRKSCGISEEPTSLYRKYWQLIGSPDIRNWLPKDLLKLGVFFNAMWVMLFLCAVGAFFGLAVTQTVSLLMLLCGSFIGQFPSVTDDIPFYIGGWWIVALFLGSLTSVHSSKKLVALFATLIAYFYLLEANRIWIVAAPGLVASAICCIFCFYKPAGEIKKSQALRGALIYSLVIMISIPTINLLAGSSAPAYRGFINNTLFADYVPNISLLSIPENLFLFWRHWCSYVGSFVWGHSYFDVAVYCIYTLFFILLSGVGLMYGPKEKNKFYLVTFSLAGAFVGQVVVANSIAAPFYNSSVGYFESFTKIRLSAPGLAGLVFLPAIGIIKVLTIDKGIQLEILKFFAWSWVLFLLLYYLPKFYLLDLY
jgi:hypothetical protein